MFSIFIRSLTFALFLIIHQGAHADCLAAYEQQICTTDDYIKGAKARDKFKDGPHYIKDLFPISEAILNSPVTVFQKLASCSLRLFPRVIGIAPGVGAIIIPPLITPIAIGGALVTPPIGTSIIAAKMAYDRTQMSKTFIKNYELYSLMQALARVKTAHEGYIEKPLKKLLKEKIVKASYDDKDAALSDLRKAYELNFFCPENAEGEVSIMTRKEILQSIKDGSLQTFLADNAD